MASGTKRRAPTASSATAPAPAPRDASTALLIGYARVSTEDQRLDLQLDALARAGCHRTFEDRASGARANRPGLAAALSHLRRGGTLVVWRLDRLGRATHQLVGLLEQFERDDVRLHSLQDRAHTRAGLSQLQPARASLTCLAGAKISLREATISIVSPVAGLHPWRAGLSLTLNLPKPG